MLVKIVFGLGNNIITQTQVRFITRLIKGDNDEL